MIDIYARKLFLCHTAYYTGYLLIDLINVHCVPISLELIHISAVIRKLFLLLFMTYTSASLPFYEETIHKS